MLTIMAQNMKRHGAETQTISNVYGNRFSKS
ncbi:YALI0C16269p [Yarrowia lipolytica CLIB122]|uniref:YALI0C16269p n=1 Tax=Yarrowia lipolytica (strain CLIB 122 / E 150) TaxID=284591 RepID=Q6CBR4_YARLI|nr:YALI0C16269p [Yarrowia lipolytica CLIB122]CAG82215.1 YALI0C16269p [Yarrowia lipolytica CLIB122]|eukprot:XP_501898.1 YALI0C16269p [Yarrowia lipolytica CLIB122]